MQSVWRKPIHRSRVCRTYFYCITGRHWEIPFCRQPRRLHSLSLYGDERSLARFHPVLYPSYSSSIQLKGRGCAGDFASESNDLYSSCYQLDKECVFVENRSKGTVISPQEKTDSYCTEHETIDSLLLLDVSGSHRKYRFLRDTV